MLDCFPHLPKQIQHGFVFPGDPRPSRGAQPSPSLAQGPSRDQGQISGNVGIWDPKNPKNKTYQNQNPCRPKCRQGKVWISRKQIILAPFGAILGPSGPIFCVGRKNQKIYNFCIFSLVANGPYSPLAYVIKASMLGLRIV